MIFPRQGWLVVGLGASLALHASLAFWMARARAPAEAPPFSPGPPGAEAVEFQLVPMAGRPDRGPPRRPAGRASAKTPEAILTGPASPSPAAVPPPASSAPATAPEGSGRQGAEEGPGGAGPGDGDAALLSAGMGSRGGAPALAGLLSERLAAAALRCYPREAVRFRLAGEALLSFCLGEDGRASQVRVARSSGAEALDRAAAECVLPGALPLPGAAGCYELPVRFSARGR